jgi:hypothetical protein
LADWQLPSPLELLSSESSWFESLRAAVLVVAWWFGSLWSKLRWSGLGRIYREAKGTLVTLNWSYWQEPVGVVGCCGPVVPHTGTGPGFRSR